jgi:hypothetical protein
MQNPIVIAKNFLPSSGGNGYRDDSSGICHLLVIWTSIAGNLTSTRPSRWHA